MNSQQTISTPKPVTPKMVQSENRNISKTNVPESSGSEFDDPASSDSLEGSEIAKINREHPLYKPDYDRSTRYSSMNASARAAALPSVKLATNQISSIGMDEDVALVSHHITWKLMSGTTVGQALASATKRLRSIELLTAQLDAQVILARLLGCDRSWLFAHHDDVLSDDELGRYSELVARRTNYEPVAYLIGCKEFYGLEFMVDERVLIPRPETELLVDAVLDHIEMRAHDLLPGKRLSVADIGTGSGAIAIAVATNSPNVDVYATDLSPDALEITRLNIKGLDKRCQVSLLEGDLLAPLMNKFDKPRVNVIVANLPYITIDDYTELQRDVRDYEPQLALTAGPEGLDTIYRLLEQAPECIEPDGLILLEIGADQGPAVVAMAQELIPQASSIILRQDHNGRDRLVMIAM